LCTPDGVIPRRFDVVVTSNCLEHFAEPLAVLASLAAAADRLLLVLVPFAEEPLCEYHVARFDDTTFPAQFEGFRRLAALRVTVDPRYWAGEQLLVVYGSPTDVPERGQRAGHVGLLLCLARAGDRAGGGRRGQSGVPADRRRAASRRRPRGRGRRRGRVAEPRSRALGALPGDLAGLLGGSSAPRPYPV